MTRLRLKIANSDADVGTTFFGGAAVGGGAYGGGYIDQTTGNAYQLRISGNEKFISGLNSL